MNFKTTIILGVLLVLGLVFVFVARRSEPDTDNPSEQPPPGGPRKLLELASADVERVSIKPASGSTIVLSKAGEKWKLSQPVEWPAAEFEAGGLVSDITGLKSRGIAPSANLGSYGLDKPRYTIELTAKDKKTTTIEVGNDSAIGRDFYVKLGSGSEVHLVTGGSLGEKLGKGADKLALSLRDKALVRAETSAVRQVTIAQGDKKLVLRKALNDWKLVEPVQEDVDSAEVDGILRDLTGMQAAEFVPNDSPLAAGARINQPEMTVWISNTTPTTQPSTTTTGGTTIAFGQYADVEREKMFVKVSDTNTLAKVAISQATFDKISGATPVSLRDKKVVDITPGEVSRISVATDITAATQPTSRPASKTELVIERRKENAMLGPDLPAGPATKPTTGPTTQASTQPATQPAGPVLPVSNWVLKSQKDADASNARVDALLAKFNPLRADKYLPSTTATSQPSASYTVEITAEVAGKKTVHLFRITDPGSEKPLIVAYKELRFELPRSFVDSITGDFINKIEKIESPMPTNMPPGMMPPGMMDR